MFHILFILATIGLSFAQNQAPNTPQPVNTVVAPEQSYLHPGWSGKYKHALGYSTTFTQTTTFIYDYYHTPETSYSTYFGFTKAASNFTQTEANNGTAKTITNSGSKTGATITLGESINRRVFRNDFTNIRLGWILGLNYFTKAKYDIGSRSTNLNTGVVTDSAYGDAKVEREMQFFTGPVISTALNIRWLPMITVGMDGGLLVFTESSTETKFKQTTGAVTTSSKSKTEPGMSANMSGNGIFNLFGNFTIRYVW